MTRTCESVILTVPNECVTYQATKTALYYIKKHKQYYNVDFVQVSFH